jgi:hypothetical protein
MTDFIICALRQIVLGLMKENVKEAEMVRICSKAGSTCSAYGEIGS